MLAKMTSENQLTLPTSISYPKFKLSPADREELPADCFPYCRSVRIPARLPKLQQRRDKNNGWGLTSQARHRSEPTLASTMTSPPWTAGSKRPSGWGWFPRRFECRCSIASRLTAMLR